jgi:hypothetical protein
MKFHWNSLVILLFLALVGCSPSQTLNQSHAPLASRNADTVSSVSTDATATRPAKSATTAPASNAAETGTWTSYENTQAGYSVQYPSAWTVNEKVGTNGELITMFTAPSDGQSIAISVQNSNTVVEEIPDMPNTRCQQVVVGDLSGTRCLDTIAFSITTTFVHQGKAYILASSAKHIDQNIYQRFLSSFAVKS